MLNVLKKNLESHDYTRITVALSVISVLKPMELENSVAALMDDPDPANQRRAIGVLGILGSHVADQRLLANLDPTKDEALIKNSMDALFKLQVQCWAQLRPLLEYPTITVREDLIGDLINNASMYDKELRTELNDTANGADNALDTRALRSVLKVFASGAMLPDDGTANAISIFLKADDWGTRADAVKVVQRWHDLANQAVKAEGDPLAAIEYQNLVEPLLAQLDDMKKTETDPFVLFVLSGKQPGK